MNGPTNSISCIVRFKEYYKEFRKIYLKASVFECATQNILQAVIIVVNGLNQATVMHQHLNSNDTVKEKYNR